MDDINIINYIKVCQYCDKEITKDMNIYYIYDNPTCSRNSSYLIHYEIIRRDPTLSKPELWTINRQRSKSF